jgi:PKD repeat protein
LQLSENAAFDYMHDGVPISYGEVALGVTFDPETGVIYQLDAGSRTIYVLTPLSPKLNSITPASGTTKGGTETTLQGSLFPSDAWVYFDGVPAVAVEVLSSTRIKAKTPSHAAGTADVTVTGTNIPWNEPLRLTAGYLYANMPPIAFLSASPTSGQPPLLVQLSAAGSNDPDGALVSRILYFGDGGSYVFSSPTASSAIHTYADRGVYTATLTVTDDEGVSSSATKKIYVGTGGDDLTAEAGLNAISMTVGLADESGVRDRLSVKGSFLLPADEEDLKEAEVEIGVGGVVLKLTLDDKERCREKDVSMVLKRAKNRFSPNGTYVFSFRGKGLPLKDGLEAAGIDLSKDGIAAADTYVRFTTIRGRTLTYAKRAVVEIRSRNGKNATVRRH